MADQTFGQIVQQLRQDNGQSLRQFCQAHGYTDNRQSRIERDLEAPPDPYGQLPTYLVHLGVCQGTPLWDRLMDLAAIANKRIPPRMVDCLRTSDQVDAAIDFLAMASEV